jgi:hypothetical protein
MAKVLAEIVFSGEHDNDVEGAAEALRQVGFTVHRFPDERRDWLSHPRDDFLQAVRDGAGDTMGMMMRAVGGIVAPFGGWCECCSEIGDDFVPFTTGCDFRLDDLRQAARSHTDGS